MAHQEKEASNSEAEFKSPENRLCSAKSERTMEECAISELSLECTVASPYSHVPNEMCTTDSVTKAGNSEMVKQHTAIERKNSEAISGVSQEGSDESTSKTAHCPSNLEEFQRVTEEDERNVDLGHEQRRKLVTTDNIKERLISTMYKAVACIETYYDTSKETEASTVEIKEMEVDLSKTILDIHSQFGIVKEHSLLQDVAESIADSPRVAQALCTFVEHTFERLGTGISLDMAASLLSVEHWFWDCSQESDMFCAVLSKKGMILHFLYQLGELRKNSIHIETVKHLMLISIGVVNSFATRSEYHKQFADIEYYRVLTPYILSPLKQLRFASLFTLSYLADIIPEELTHLLAIEKGEVEKTVQELSLSVNTNEVHLGTLVFSTAEILVVLRNLAMLHKNATALISCNILKTLGELFTSTDVEIRLYSLLLLWSLSYLKCKGMMETILTQFEPLSSDEEEVKAAVEFETQVSTHKGDANKTILAMRACYKYHKYVNCLKVFESINPFHDSKETDEAKLLHAKALFHLFQKEQRSLSKLSSSIKEYRVQHHSCYLKAKEIIQLLGAALDGGYLDAEASKFLDLSMIAYVSETNNLKPLKRCVLCRRRAPLRRSHLWPESLLQLYKSSVDSPGSHKLFYKISEDGTLSTWSPHQYSYWMFCSECEQTLSRNGETQCIPLIKTHIYNVADPSSSSQHLHIRYKEWLYHFCIGLIFRGLASPDPHVSITAFTNEDEIYELLVLCRQAILDLQKMKEISPKFRVTIFFTPTHLQDNVKHSGFINSLLTSFGLFALSDACLSDGSVCKPREAQFFLAHCGVFNIIVPLGKSHGVNLQEECIIAPVKGTYSIPAGEDRLKHLPPGVMTFFRLLADCKEVSFLVQPKKIEEHSWIEPRPEREKVVGYNAALDQDIEQTGGKIRPSWLHSNPKELNYLPRAFQIHRPFHHPNSVILPPGHKILLHHTYTIEEDHTVTLFLAVGSDKTFSVSKPYIIQHSSDKQGFQVSTGFFISPETLTATDFLPDNLEKSLTPMGVGLFSKEGPDKLRARIEEMLCRKGFANMYSLLLHSERDRNNKVFDMKCSPRRCWYCRDLCELCMKQCVVGCEMIDHHNHFMYTFCNTCWEDIQMSKLDEQSLPEITMLPFEETEDLNSARSIFPYHKTLLSFQFSSDAFDHFTVSICVTDASSLYRRPYVLTEVRTLNDQDCAECFISQDFSPLLPLPFCENCEVMQTKVTSLKEEGFVQSLVHHVLTSEDCKETLGIFNSYFSTSDCTT